MVTKVPNGLDLQSQKIVSLGTPTTSTDAATQGYSDGLIIQPWDQGCVAWTHDPFVALNGAVAVVAGVVYLTALNVGRAGTVSNISVLVSIAAAGTVTNCFAGLYNSSGTRLAITADQSAAWNSVSFRTMAVTPVAVTPGRYYCALVVGAASTTLPQFARGGNTGSSLMYNVGALAANSNLRCATVLTGQTTLSSSLTVTNFAASNVNTWFGLT